MLIQKHKAQFIISNMYLNRGDGWSKKKLSSEFDVLYHDSLELTYEETATSIYIRHKQDLHQSGGQRGGRYVSIDLPLVAPDSSCSFSIFYGKFGNAIVIASSIGIVLEAIGDQIKSCNTGITMPSRSDVEAFKPGISWFPPPYTEYDGLFKLLPDQAVSLPDLTVRRKAACFEKMDFDSAVELVSDELVENVTAVSKKTSDLNILLTGGLDSRTVLAACTAAGLSPNAITHDVKPRSDGKVAKKLSSMLGLSHTLVKPKGAYYDADMQDHQNHINGIVDKSKQNFLQTREYRQDGSVYLTGLVFELGRAVLKSKFDGLTLDNFTSAELSKRFGVDMSSGAAAAFEQWAKIRRENTDGLEIYDSFYRDHMLCGWVAQGRQATDALAGTDFSIANSHRIMSALLAPCVEDRRSARLQREVIRRLEPKLLSLPINPRPISDYPAGAWRILKRLIWSGHNNVYQRIRLR